MGDFADVLLWVYVSVVLNVAIVVVGLIVAAMLFFALRKQAIPHLSRVITVLPTVLESCNYAEVPIAIVGVLTGYKQIAVEDLAAEYARDSKHRRALVLETFGKDKVTDRFIADFPSKFIQHGYVGEELLAPLAAAGPVPAASGVQSAVVSGAR
ncbi:hypothetical protein M3Y99_00038700 [Aphelenchoides fujianensis]|nr:hypothetical protein M3Y99_00038700 [Aphelenchoides fujianensis]